MFHSGEKMCMKIDILKQIAYKHMLCLIKKRPLDINVETVSLCPLKCVFCCNRVYKREYLVMDNGLFEKIIKEYYRMGGGAIGLGSMQSDFLSDPLLLNRIKIIKKYKKKLWLYSTTPLITCKKYSDKELKYILSAFDYLQISAEGYDRESYQIMSGIDGFDIFEEQLKRIKRIKDTYSLNVRIGIHFRTCNRGKLKVSKFYKEISKIFYIEDIKDSFFSWFGTIKKEDLPSGAHLKVTHNDNKCENCVVPNATLSVQPSGKVVGCGCIDWLEKYVIGDCKNQTLKEIWKSKRAVKFRNAFSEKKIPQICRECGLYAPINKCMEDISLLRYKPLDGVYYLVKNKGW